MTAASDARNVEVHLDLDGSPQRVGLLRRHASRQQADTLTFEYDPAWLEGDQSFELDPGLPLTAGLFEATRSNGMASAFEHDDLKRALVI